MTKFINIHNINFDTDGGAQKDKSMSKSGTTLQIQTTVLFIAIITLLGLSSAQSQFVDFGRNKVQYSDFKWNTLETDHFVIYYYEGAQELAEHGAFFAEEA
ncbi:MAG TPA: hypothetical protein VK004_06045, partial [Ignavibacteria bacterium]|nr:hypothetical protein [Ignavibacteria bacterium]